MHLSPLSYLSQKIRLSSTLIFFLYYLSGDDEIISHYTYIHTCLTDGRKNKIDLCRSVIVIPSTGYLVFTGGH